MELLRLAGFRRNRTGKKESLGVFACTFCQSEVVRVLSDGRRNKSCGCARTSARVTHSPVRGGERHAALSVVWNGMKARCYSSRNTAYHRYGGRGVRICHEWLSDPSAFFRWALENGWEKGLNIDRVDNDGDYGPSNCVITTHAGNCSHRVNSKLNHDLVAEMRKRYADGGLNLRELGDLYGVTDATAGKIINQKIWKCEEVAP